MAETFNFTHPNGVTTFTELDELTNHYGFLFETVLPKFDVKIKGHSYHDDDGLVSFSVEANGPKGTTIYNGYREEGGLQVNINGGGFAGQMFFGAGTFDLTTLDLHALDKSDFEGVKDGEEVWLLDPIRLDYYRATVTTRTTRNQTTVALDIEGETYETTFNADGEAVEGKRAEVAWAAASAEKAAAHLAGLKRSLTE